MLQDIAVGSSPIHLDDGELSQCVSCGLCLPHCPTYRLTGDETASPRGRIAAMRAVSDGAATVDATFARIMPALTRTLGNITFPDRNSSTRYGSSPRI